MQRTLSVVVRVRYDTRVSTSIKPSGENPRVSANKRRPMLDVSSLSTAMRNNNLSDLSSLLDLPILPRTKIVGQPLSSKLCFLADHLRTRSAC